MAKKEKDKRRIWWKGPSKHRFWSDLQFCWFYLSFHYWLPPSADSLDALIAPDSFETITTRIWYALLVSEPLIKNSFLSIEGIDSASQSFAPIPSHLLAEE